MMAMPDNESGAGYTRPEAMSQERASNPIWCNGCRTDAHIVVDCAWKPLWVPEGTLEVSYF